MSDHFKKQLIVKDYFKALKYVISFDRTAAIFVFTSRILGGVIPVGVSVIWAKFIDEVVKGFQNNNLSIDIVIMPFALFILMQCINTLFGAFESYFVHRAYNNRQLKVHFDMFTKYSSLEISSIEDPEVNKLFQRIRDNYGWQPGQIFDDSSRMLARAFSLISASIVLVTISPIAFLIIFVTSLPLLIVNIKYGEVLWGVWNGESGNARKYSLIHEFLLDKENLFESKITDANKYLIKAFDKIQTRFFGIQLKKSKEKTLLGFVASVVSIIGSSVALWLIIGSVISQSITLGQFMVATSVYLSLAGNLKEIIEYISSIFESTLFMRDFFKFLEIHDATHNGAVQIETLTEAPLIELKNVIFKYPHSQTNVLDGINLVIKPGEKIAIVGENGAGKSTLIKLLCRFYDPTVGDIDVNGRNLREIDFHTWRQNISTLFQHFNTYKPFSVKENILLGRMPVGLDIEDRKLEDEVLNAAEKAKIDEFVNKYDNKYDKILTAQLGGGIDPSWGQWQRISIARMFYRNSPVLILDEPTSAIDAQAEYEIFESINNFTQGKTVIYVSHRFSTVRNADRICVIKDGIIAEQGSHKELIAMNGIYAKNFALQADGYK